MASYGQLLTVKSAVQNKTNSYWVVLGVGFSAGDLAGASNTNIMVIADFNGNQLDCYVASTPAGEFNGQGRKAVIPPGGKIRSDLTNGINVQYIACSFAELSQWL